MEKFVVPVFHHGENFVRDNKGVFLYLDEKVEKFSKMDVDLICFFDLQTLFKELGYLNYTTMYWYDVMAADFESGLHPIKGELEINQLCENIQKNKGTDEFHLYFDHPIMVTSLEDIDLDFEGDADAEEESSDDDRYETTEDEPYKPPPPGFEDESSDSDYVIVKKKSSKTGKKSESGMEKKKSKVDKKQTSGPSSIRPSVNGPKSARTKTEGPSGS